MPRAIWKERGVWGGKNFLLFLMSLPLIFISIYVLGKVWVKSCFKKQPKSNPRIQELTEPLVQQSVSDDGAIELREIITGSPNSSLNYSSDSSPSSSSSASSSSSDSPNREKSSMYGILAEVAAIQEAKEVTLASSSFSTPGRKKRIFENEVNYQISMWDDLSLISQHGIDWYIARHGVEAIIRFFAPIFGGIEMAGAITITLAELIIRDIENSDAVGGEDLQKYNNMIVSIAVLTSVLSAAVWPKRFVNPLVRTFQVQAATLLGAHIMEESGWLKSRQSTVAVGVTTSTGLMLFQAVKSTNRLQANCVSLSPSAKQALNTMIQLVNKALSAYCIGISLSDMTGCFSQVFLNPVSDRTVLIIAFGTALGLAGTLWAVECGKCTTKPGSYADKIFKRITMLVEGVLDNGTVLGSQFFRFVANLMITPEVLANGDYSSGQKIEIVVLTAFASLVGAVCEAQEIGSMYDKEREGGYEESSTSLAQPKAMTKEIEAFNRLVEEANDLVVARSPIITELLTSEMESAQPVAVACAL